MNGRKVVSVVLIGLIMTGMIFASGQKDQVTGDDGVVRVAMVFNQLGDMGFNDEGFSGLEMARDELGVEINYVEAPEIAEVESQLSMYAEDGIYDLILVLGATYADSITSVAKMYPEQRFSIVDTALEGHGLQNLHGVAAWDPEQTFLSGCIAGFVTMSDEMPLSDGNNVVGFVGRIDSPASRAGAAGFLAGAKYANPNVELIYTIAGGYRDPSKGKEIALAAYDKGADVVSHNAGGTGFGVFDAAAEVNKYVIGSSLSSIDVDRSLCTSMKRTDLFVFQEIEAIVNGTWKAGSDRKGLAEGGCYYDVENLNTVLPEKIVAAVEEIKNRVISGEVKLVNDPSEIEAWSKVNFY